MLTFAEALEKEKSYSPYVGWSDEERAEMNAFFRNALPEEQAALQKIMSQKTHQLLEETRRFREEVKQELSVNSSK